MRSFRLQFLIALIALIASTVPVWAQGGSAVMVLQQDVGARQHGLGGAGVALPDAGQGMNWNPALAGMSFPRERRTLSAANAWANIGTGPEWGYRDTDAPLAFEAGPFGTPLTGYPGWYHPGLGYAGLDRQEYRTEPFWGMRERYYALTLATAPDFLLPPGYRDPSWWEWTLGLTVKWYGSDLGGYSSSGPAVDAGAAWRIARIPFLPGVRAVAGAALANLGAPARYDGAGASDPLPEQWRLGWSLAWRPWARTGPGREWHPLQVTVTQELRREFHSRLPDGEARAFPGSLLHDLIRRPAEAWRERSARMGAEATLAGAASLRIGRLREGYFRGYRGGGAAYTWGYGISTGPWLGPRVALSYDFARFFRTASLRPMYYGTLHQESLQVRLSW